MKRLLILFVVLLLAGCASSVSELQNDAMVGKSVTVSGTVKETIKAGPISGYTLSDKTGTLPIQSDTVPAAGEKVKVSGIMQKNNLVGYYLLEK